MPTADATPAPMRLDGDLTVIGGNVACLVAALAAARAGAETSLVLPARGIGTDFAPMQQDGFRLDLGCRRLDLTEDAVTRPLSDYAPGTGTRPFAPHVRRFLEEDLGLRLAPTPAPKIVYRGHYVDDFVSSLNLTSLPDLLTREELSAVERETRNLLDAPSPLTLGTGKAPKLHDAGLEDASLANHGPAFHGLFIAPFARKLDPQGWQGVPADLAGKIWTPLLYPATINEGCHGRIHRGRGAVTYFYPAAGYFGSLVEALHGLLDKTPNLAVLTAGDLQSFDRQGTHTTATFADGKAVAFTGRSVLGCSVETYSRLGGEAGEMEKLPLAILWLEVKRDDLLAEPGLLHIFEPDTDVYRISFGGAGVREGYEVLTLEMTGHSPECTQAGAADLLSRLGVVREGAALKVITTRTAVPIAAPSRANRQRLAAARARLESEGIAPRLTGTLNDLGAGTLNDQILQGLTAAL